MMDGEGTYWLVTIPREQTVTMTRECPTHSIAVATRKRTQPATKRKTRRLGVRSGGPLCRQTMRYSPPQLSRVVADAMSGDWTRLVHYAQEND
ncbi:hypothetical protein NDU88_002361 [Pleurodeles waltl]|uniref:Uncharacterized protein n=1 Tax=Pleurodeles waltl TaxID=8319 RepID=A0AAV7NHS8_PLEWA|nr:hypothetical protein NDU88_002361 [Pleurodeles waltl]